MFLRQTSRILTKKAFYPPQRLPLRFQWTSKKEARKGRWEEEKSKSELIFDRLKILMGHFFHSCSYFRPVHTGLWTAKVVPYERNSRKHEPSIGRKFHFASSPAFSPSPWPLCNSKRLNEGESKNEMATTSENSVDQNTFPSQVNIKTSGKIIFTPLDAFLKNTSFLSSYSRKTGCTSFSAFCSVQNSPGNSGYAIAWEKAM